MEYILGTYHRLFQDVAVRDTQHHLDHYMILGYLRGETAKDLTGYLRKALRPPLRPLYRNFVLTPDKLFSYIKTQIPNLPLRERVRRDWIYDKTWEAIDARVTARQEGDHRKIQKLIRRICTSLRTDWKRLAEDTGHTINSCRHSSL